MTSPTHVASRRLRLISITACTLLLGFVMPVMMITSLWRKSVTFDEPYCVAMGYNYLKTGETRYVSRFNPPLAPVLTALPLLSLGVDRAQQPGGTGPELHTTAAAFFAGWQDPEVVLRLARLPVLLVTMLLGLGVYAWSRELFGPLRALISVVLYAFAPNVLAHGRLATSDLIVTAAFFFAAYSFWRFLCREKRRSVLFAGIFLGLAMLSKLSAILLLPWMLLAALIEVLLPQKARASTGIVLSRSRRAGRLVLALLAVSALALVTIAAGYLPDLPTWISPGPTDSPGSTANAFRPDPAASRVDSTPAVARPNILRHLPVPPAYADCVLELQNKMRDGHVSFLCGDYRTHGWWSYFPKAFAVKTTIPFLVLLAGAVGMSFRPGRDFAYLLLAPGLFFAASMTSPLNIGFRHVLPAMPFLFVACGGILPRATHTLGRHVLLGATILLVGWHVAESLFIYPDYLAYFNEFVGGPRNGYKCLVDSNLDWGQDVGRIGPKLRQMGIQGAVHFAVFGRTSPGAAGVEFRDASRRPEPRQGTWVVSATEIQGLYWADRNRFAWLRDNARPIANIGYSIFIYRVTVEDIDRLNPGGSP